MSDEKMKILKLIENNEITPAEGLELINQLDEKEKLNEDLSNDNFNEREALREKRIEERANEREKRNEERAKDRLERDREKLEKDKKKIEIDIESIKNEAINMGKEIKENLDMSFIKEAVNNAVSSINPIEVSDDTEFDDDKETRDYNIAQEFSLNCDTKKEIVVTVISTDINIVTEEREDILVKYISY